MESKEKKGNGIEKFSIGEYNPINGRIIVTLNSDSKLLKGKDSSSILDYQEVVAVQKDADIKVGDIVLLDIESLIVRIPREGKDGKTIVEENIKINSFSVDGKVYGEVRFSNIRGFFKK